MVKAKKIKENRWRASIYLGKNEYGKKIYKDIYGTSEKECNTKVIDFLYQKEKGLLEETKLDFKTFGDYYSNWINKRIDIKDTTKQEYLSVERCHLTPLLKLDVKKLNQSVFIKFFKDLYDQKGGKIVKKVYRIINTFLSSIDNNYLNTTLLKGVSLPKTYKFIPYKIKDEQYTEFINILKKEYDDNSRIGYLYILLILCGGLGLRIGEALAVTYDDIDFENSIIKIFKEQTRIKGLGYVIQETVKTENSLRTAVIPDFVYEFLKQDAKKRKKLISDFDRLNVEINDDVTYIDKNNKKCTISSKKLLICSQNLEFVAKNTVQRNWKNFRESLGYFEQIRIHDFRRFLATILMKNDIPDSISKLQLGHGAEKMTRYYQNVDEDLLKNYIKNINFKI